MACGLWSGRTNVERRQAINVRGEQLAGIGGSLSAPTMIDTATRVVYCTPIYHVPSQFSRTIRSGDEAVQTRRVLDGPGSDDLHACATINGDGLLSVQLLNTTQATMQYKLQIGDRFADITIPANSMQTVRFMALHGP